MQVVDLEQRQLVEVALHLLDGEEVARDIQHGSAVREAGVVVDGDEGESIVGAQLVERDSRVERPGGVGCGDADARGIHLEAVALGRQCLVEGGLDLVVGGVGALAEFDRDGVWDQRQRWHGTPSLLSCRARGVVDWPRRNWR